MNGWFMQWKIRFHGLESLLWIPICGVMVIDIAVNAQSVGGASTNQAGPVESVKPRLERILVKPKAGIDLKDLQAFHASKGAKVKDQFPAMGNLQVVELKKGDDVNKLLEAYKRSGLVEYAEPDHKVRSFGKPRR